MIIEFKIFEKIYLKNIIPGRIYRIGEFIIGDMGYRITIPLARLLDCDEGKNILTIKTFLKETNEEHIFDVHRSFIKNIASPEEIIQFEHYEMMKDANKYNL